MEGFDDDGPSSQENPREFSDAGFSGNTWFDASQYAFFGKNVAEEVELGGLDDADDPLVGFDDEKYRFSSIGEREEVEGMKGFSELDDLATTFMKLNKAVEEPRSIESIGNREFLSRETQIHGSCAPEVSVSTQLDTGADTLDAVHAVTEEQQSPSEYELITEYSPGSDASPERWFNPKL